MVTESVRSGARQRHLLRRCRACNAALLADDFLGCVVTSMDNALVHHEGARCVDRRRARDAHADRISALLEATDSGPYPWPDEEPPLIFCARYGLTELASRLLAARSSCDYSLTLNLIAVSGLGAIHLAAVRDESYELLAALLQAGASPRWTTQDGTEGAGGRLALHCAAAAGAGRCAQLLLRADVGAAAVADWDGLLPAQSASLAARPLGPFSDIR